MLYDQDDVWGETGNGYYYCTTSFNKAWAQVLHRFKFRSQHVRDSQWWGSLTMVLAGNKAKCFSLVKYTTKTIHHHHHWSESSAVLWSCHPLRQQLPNTGYEAWNKWEKEEEWTKEIAGRVLEEEPGTISLEKRRYICSREMAKGNKAIIANYSQPG